jgi:hypothetical protein
MGREGLNDVIWAKPLQGSLEGVGPEMATTEASVIWAQNAKIFRAHPVHQPE